MSQRRVMPQSRSYKELILTLNLYSTLHYEYDNVKITTGMLIKHNNWKKILMVESQMREESQLKKIVIASIAGRLLFDSQ